MFEGVRLHMDLVGGGYFVSVNRDSYTGDLYLDANPAWFPNRIYNLLAEFDFPPYQPDLSRVQK